MRSKNYKINSFYYFFFSILRENPWPGGHSSSGNPPWIRTGYFMNFTGDPKRFLLDVQKKKNI